MKVLHILCSGHFSGAENVVCQIIEMYKQDPNVVMAYCSYDGPIREVLRDKGILFYPYTELTVSEIKRVLKEYRPDIIHAHDMHASFIAAIACKKTRLISHIHNNAYDSRGLSIKSLAYLIAAIKAEKIIWVSRSSMKGYVFNRLFSNKSEILYNVVNTDEIRKRAETDQNTYGYDVVYVGRITYPKNVQRLITIIGNVVKVKPDISVAIVGTGDEENEVKKLTEDLHLSNNVSFLGFMNMPLGIMKQAKVLAMTSRWEGTPMCALEAIALGVPIISTPTDGIVDLVQDGINGYLASDDTVYCDRLVRICTDDNLQQSMSRKQKELSLSINDVKKYKESLDKFYAYKSDDDEISNQ